MVRDIMGIGRTEILDSDSSMVEKINSILGKNPFNVDVNKTIRQIENDFLKAYPELSGEWFPLFEFKYSGSYIYATDKDIILCDTMAKLASCGLKMQIGRLIQAA